LLQAGNFIETIEQRQGLKVGCLEEIGFELGYLSREDLIGRGNALRQSEYGQYLLRIAHESAHE
jgi:glucose-1-phosphate thymidylyltransferase